MFLNDYYFQIEQTINFEYFLKFFFEFINICLYL